MLRILITGGRDQIPRAVADHLHFLLDGRTDIECIIQGCARGADTGAIIYANEAKVPLVSFPVSSDDWNKIGKSAGYKRNKKMRDEGKPDLIIAFPGGRGTQHMIDLGIEKNIRIHIVGEE